MLLGAGRSETAGFGLKGINSWQYARSEFGVILHYLRLSFWPGQLCLDYAWPVAKLPSQYVPHGIAIAILAVGTVWALWRQSPWGLLGAWFFMILAPTSSIMPVADLAFEHRMYLSLASVVIVALIGVYLTADWLMMRRNASAAARRRLGLLGVATVIVIATAMGVRTGIRNKDYHDAMHMWGLVTQQRPGNPRGWINHSNELMKAGRGEEAIAEVKRALEIQPNYHMGYNNLGQSAAAEGDLDLAVEHFNKALEYGPKNYTAHYNLAVVLARQEDYETAVEHFRITLEGAPEHVASMQGLAHALLILDRPAEAVVVLRRAVELQPKFATAHATLGDTLVELGEIRQAFTAYGESLKLQPMHRTAMIGMAWLLATSDDPQLRNGPKAVKLATTACTGMGGKLNPRYLDILAAAYAETGQFKNAIQVAERIHQMALKAGKSEFAATIAARLDGYKAGKPFRLPTK